MLGLLIVEDEYWEREGLVDFIDWKSFGIDAIYTACDGAGGLEAARRLLPDIIITDIKMPVMDGLKMAAAIRGFLPDVHIIVLTGYDDFKLAQEAIGCGADAYILKPVEEEDMVQAVSQAVSKIRRDQGILVAAREKWLLDLLEGLSSDEIIKKLTGTGGIYPGASYLVLSLLSMAASGQSKENAVNRLFRALCSHRAGERESHQKNGMMEIVRGRRGELLVFFNQAFSVPDAEMRISRSLRAVEGFIPEDWAIGIGQIVPHIPDIARSCVEAREASGYGFFWGIGGMIRYSAVKTERQLAQGSWKEFCIRGNSLADDIHQILKTGDRDALMVKAEELFSGLEKNRGTEKQRIASQLYSLMREIWTREFFTRDEMDGSVPSESLLNGRLFELSRFVDMKAYFIDFMEQTRECLQDKRSHMRSYIVQSVKNFAETKYMMNINLQSAASEVFVSPNYLGVLFKKHTGQSFNDYLASVRMLKAKELLSTAGNQVRWVAGQVGIPNVSYFCAVFKKTFGQSPGEYQQNILL